MFVLSNVIHVGAIIFKKIITRGMLNAYLRYVRLTSEHNVINLRHVLHNVLLAIIVLILRAIRVIYPVKIVTVICFVFHVKVQHLQANICLMKRHRRTILSLRRALMISASISKVPKELTTIRNEMTMGKDDICILQGDDSMIHETIALIPTTPGSRERNSRTWYVCFMTNLRTTQLREAISLITTIVIRVKEVLHGDFQYRVLTAATMITKLIIMVMVMTNTSNRLSTLCNARYPTTYATITSINARHDHVTFRSTTRNSSIRGATRALNIVLKTKVNCRFGVLSAIYERAFRRFHQIITRRIIKLSISVCLGTTAPIRLGVILTVRHCRQCLTGRFRRKIQLNIEIVLRVMLCLISVYLRRELLYRCFRLPRLVKNVCSVRHTRIRRLLPYLREGILRSKDASRKDSNRRRITHAKCFLLRLTFRIHCRRFRHLYENLFLRSFGNDVEFALLNR